MRRIRNPRYAPEFLEKKLYPSDLGVLPTPVPAETAAMESPPVVVNYEDPPDVPGPKIPPYDPEIPPSPTLPTGPLPYPPADFITV